MVSVYNNAQSTTYSQAMTGTHPYNRVIQPH
jgi:hypothetical protein